MGTWTIRIDGCGAHDNGKEYDADEQMRRFITLLKSYSQRIDSASFELTDGAGRVISSKDMTKEGEDG